MTTRVLRPVARVDLVVSDAGSRWWVSWSGSFGVGDAAVPSILRACARRLLDEADEIDPVEAVSADG